MSATAVRVSPEWLALREPADAAARSRELAARLARRLSATTGAAARGPRAAHPLVVHDLGGGSGAMGRWLAPRLPGPQHWVVHDRDAGLLALAAADAPPAVTVEVRQTDITRPAPGALSGADLVVASALLDLLTGDQLLRMLGACRGLPLLLALTVVGRVALTPADPLDAALATAFDAHQRRGGRLGPDAVAAAAGALNAGGAAVLVRPSPWRLGAGQAALAAEWLDGWVAAACEQEPALAAAAVTYRDRRLAQAAAGELTVTVDHADLLVLP
jgi:hypothetical protein